MITDCKKKDSLHPNGGADDTLDLRFICNDHIVQYFGENYGVLVGEQDLTTYSMCPGQGTNRLEAARNFHAFCDSMATAMGTTLRWPYAEVPGVGHHDSLMYHTCAPGDSIPIAERMLFETPWHAVPDSALVIDFEADTLRAKLSNATIHFTNKTLNGVSYYWDFGDSTFSTQVNPAHVYLSADTFSIKLTATSNTGCSYTLRKKYYVIVHNDTGINDFNRSMSISVHPNPVSDKVEISVSPYTHSKLRIEIYNNFGVLLGIIFDETVEAGENRNIEYSTTALPSGIYYIKVRTADGDMVRKLVVVH
jgi:hypothetical protein